MAKKTKIIDMNSKTAKYFKAHRIDGKTKVQAIKVAGISNVKNTTNIERTATYQALERKYAKVLEDVISMDTVAAEHKKNILQDADKGAKNKAIQMFLDRVEPEAQQKEIDDQATVILL